MAASAVIGALRVNLGLNSAEFRDGLSSAQKSLQRAGRSMRNAGRQMSAYVTAPLAGFGALTLKTAGDFEQGMNRVAAVSGATGDQLSALREQAKELGRTTQFSASQAADAMGFLAMAGFKANEILEAMPGTLQLAASAQMDLGTTADIVSNILAGYGLEVEELGRVNDVLVKAFTSANTNLEQLGEAMKYAGPVASAAGVGFEEAAAALALMGNAGIQASMAGTSLRGAISRVLNPTSAVAGAMQEAGLSFTDAAGRLLPLNKIIEQLEPHAENAGLFMQLFGQRAGPAMAALVSQGSASLRDLTSELEDSGGTAQRIADVQMQGFNGAMRELKSAFEGLQIAIAESGLIEWAAQAARAVTAWVQKMSESNPEILKWGTVIAGLGAALGPVVFSLGLLATGIAFLISPVGLVVTALAALTAGVIAFWPEIEAAGKAVNEFLISFGEEPIAKIRAFGTAIVQMKDQALAAVQAMVTGIQEWITGKLNSIWDGVTSKIDAVKNKFYGLYDAVVGHSYIPDMVDEIGQHMNRLQGNMVVPAQQAVDGVSASMSSLGDMGQSIGQSIASAFKGVIDGSKSVKDALKDVLSQLSSMLLNSAFRTLFGAAGGGGGGGGILGGLFSGLFGGLPGFANGGQFQVGGAGGIDSQVVAFRASPNERVRVTKPGQDTGGVGVVYAPSYNFQGTGSELAQFRQEMQKDRESFEARVVNTVRSARGKRML